MVAADHKAPDRAERNDRELALLLRVGRAEGEKFRQRRGTEALLVELSLDLVGFHGAVEVDEFDVHFDLALGADREGASS